MTLPSLFSSRAEAKLMSLFSGMCLICFMALMSSATLMTVSLGNTARTRHSWHPYSLTGATWVRPAPDSPSLQSSLAPSSGNTQPTWTQKQKPPPRPGSPVRVQPPSEPGLSSGDEASGSLRPACALDRVGGAEYGHTALRPGGGQWAHTAQQVNPRGDTGLARAEGPLT